MSEFTEIGARLLVVFDGRCGFCNASVRWLARRDGHDRLRFAPADAPRVGALLGRHGLGAAAFAEGAGTLVVVREAGGEDELLLSRSDAVATLLAELPGAWPAVAAVLHAVPRPLRDGGYRIVARLRYRMGGRLEVCPLPTEREREKFLASAGPAE
ncbi:MAG: DCC1-like thiol-disulfide oxidoreductase family protein [Rhodoferax sp.]|nr:DCC1-like thiol-disulfide oxidoreductase family protein [Rhodoferax sp.]